MKSKAAKKATRARISAAKPAAEPAAPPRASATHHGPRRPQLADGKKPHDPVTHADLIGYGIIAAPTEADEQAAQKAAQVPVA